MLKMEKGLIRPVIILTSEALQLFRISTNKLRSIQMRLNGGYFQKRGCPKSIPEHKLHKLHKLTQILCFDCQQNKCFEKLLLYQFV